MVDVGFEPTTQKIMVCRRRHLLKYWWGISLFDHLQRLTKSLPKLSLITLHQVGRIHGGPVNIQAISFPGCTGESIYQVRSWGKSEKYYCFA